MLTLNSPQVVQETALRWKRENKIALVPTMGYLHEGHLELVRQAKQTGGKVIVSIFVNPLQFGPNEDFARYPRSPEADAEKLDALGVDLLFLPEVKDFYPEGFATTVKVGRITSAMEGKHRPGHFDGVATVCLKLFQTAQADFVVFGEKDYQQLRVIQQFVADLNLPITVVPVATVREKDGLALSSRNRYLTAEDRKQALAIPRVIETAKRLSKSEKSTVAEITEEAKKLLAAAHLVADYVEIASSIDLIPASDETRVSEILEPRIFIAARAGTTRLIDNAALGG